MISCKANGCSTTEPTKFNDENIPKYYYLNGNVSNDPDNPIIICKYIKPTTNNSSKRNSYSSEIAIREIKDSINDGCIVSKPLNELFINYGTPMSLISCKIVNSDNNKNYSCNLIKAKDFSYYITSETSKKKESLIECTVKSNEYSCIEYEKSQLGSSYYINTLNDYKIIKCDINGCTTEDGQNYYIDGCTINNNDLENIDKNTNCYIDNTESMSELINCSGKSCIKINGVNRDIYIKGDGEGLILCESNKCKEIENSEFDKTFINGSNEKNSKLIIIYDNNNKKWISSSVISNTLYLNGNSGEEGNNSFIYCSSSSNCSEVSGDPEKYYIDISSAVLYGYNKSNKKFESGNNNNILKSKFETGNKIKGFIVNPKTMEILKDNTNSGILVECIYDVNKSEPPTCSTEGKYLYYLDGINSKYMIKNNDKAPSIITSPVQGYYINDNNNIIECTGNENNCNIYEIKGDCSIDNIGSINNKFELCGYYDSVSGKEIKLSTIVDGKYMVTLKKNSFPGNLEGSYLLKFFNRIITPLFNEDENITTYYLISDDLTPVTTTDTIGTLYKCEGKNACVIVNSEGTYPNSDIDTINKFQNIICYINTLNNFECISSIKNISIEEVYCLKSHENSELFVCNGNCNRVDDIETSCRKEIANNGYYISYLSDRLINCIGPDKCNYDKDIDSIYYKSGILSEPIIKCVDSLNKKSCSYNKANNGFYPSNVNGKLLKCIDGICSLKQITFSLNELETEKYYISSENDKALIKCKKQTELNPIKCISYSKPKAGWYVNGDPDTKDTGNILIKCNSMSSSESISTCIESKSLKDGYVINAGLEKTLINSSNGILEHIKDGYYYINGETGKLLYCVKTKDIFNKDTFECINPSLSGRSWYKINPYEDNTSNNEDDKKMIICTKYNVCSYYSVEQMKKGYYINSDIIGKNKSFPLIYNDGTEFILKMADSRGWYINADINGEMNEKIIACQSSYSCTKKDIKNVKCSSEINGEFTTFYNDIKWCDNANEISIPVDKGKEYTIYVKCINELIPGVTIKENSEELVIPLNVSNDSILQITDGDGYSYSNNKLYFCNDKYYGKCKEVNIIPGFYFNYKNIHKVIKCNSYASCEEIDYSEKMENEEGYIFNCENSNIIYKGNEIKICNDDNLQNPNAQSLKDININEVYALKANLKNKFPGAKNRYILADVNRYYIKFKKNISEIVECPNQSIDSKKRCLKNEKIYSFSNVFNPNIYTEDLKINIYNEDDEIKYDYDTNNGFFIYNYCNQKGNSDYKKSLLTKVYIDNDVSKYECDIGHSCVNNIGNQCIEKKKSDIPIIGYIVTDDGVLREKKGRKNREEDNVVEEKIYESKYLSTEKKFIKCYNGGFCENDKENDESIIYNDDNESIIVHKNNKEYVSNIFRTLYIFTEKFKRLNRRSIDIEAYGSIYELTSVSYKLLNRTRNLFLNENKYLISNEDEVIDNGYKCYNENCYEINCDKDEYYLNTIQYGQAKNAVVKCIKDENGEKKFEMIQCNDNTDNINFENAAARSPSEAVISCTSNSCRIASSDYNGKLPQCKLEINGIVDVNSPCIRNDNSVKLKIDQHCIYYDSNKNIIYNTALDDENKVICKSLKKNGIHLFDLTLKELDVNNIKESHYGATMYNCPKNDDCYQTYGYIYNKKSDGYIKCSSEGCIHYQLSSLSDNCADAGIGNLINVSGDVKICINIDQSETLWLESEKTFHISINNNNGYPTTSSGQEILINIQNGISNIVIDSSYVLINKKNEIITKDIDNSEENKLYKCNSNEKICELINSPENGYYYSNLIINEESNFNVIECNIKCNINSNDNLNSLSFIKGQYRYWNGEDKDNIFPGNENIEILSLSDGLSLKKFIINNYILLSGSKLASANESTSLTELYQCNQLLENCNKIQKIYDGWYISGDSNYKAIKCSNENCIMVKELPNSCNNEGDFIFKDNIYYMCIGKEKYNINEVLGQSFYLNNDVHSFPNRKNYIVCYSNSVIGIGFITKYSDFSGLPTCKSVSSNSACISNNNKKILEGEYCIKSNKIYKTESSKCNEQFKSGTSVHLFLGSILITISKENEEMYKNEFDSLPNGIQMYYCKNGICNITTGYYKFDNSDVCGYGCRCDYTGCKRTESGTLIGELSRPGEIIHSNGKGEMSSDKYYYIDDFNKFPGSEKLKSFLVEAGDYYYVIFKGQGYYLLNGYDVMEKKDPEINENTQQQKRDNNLENYIDSKYISHHVKRDNSNKLYYCDSKTSICERKDELTGYYINSASEKSSLALIECISGDCKIAENIEYGKDSCGSSKLVSLIRPKNKSNYKLCSNISSGGIDIKEINTIKYMSLKLIKGDNFLGINLSGNNVPDDTTVNIVLKISGEGIEHFKRTGYVLFTNTNVIEKVEGKGILYYCENKRVYERGEYIIQCEMVNNKINGIYFNSNVFNDQRYIVCTEGSCVIKEATVSAQCQFSGSIIYNNGKHKLCTNDNIQIDINSVDPEQKLILNIDIKDEFPGVKKDNENILVSLNNEKIEYLSETTSYFATFNNNTIIEDDSKGNLQKCNYGICNRIELPENGFYIKINDKGLSNELIDCKESICFVYRKVNEGFYKSGNLNKPIIQCILPGKFENGVFKTESEIVCYERDYREGWYLNADENTNFENPMILCSTENGCQITNVEYPGWYVNNAIDDIYSYETLSDATIYPIIQCSSITGCGLYKEPLGNECRKSGDVIYSDNYGKIFKVCKSESQPISFNNLSDTEYHLISIRNKNDIPGASVGENIIRITKTEAVVLINKKNGSVIEKNYYRDGAMYSCGESCKKWVEDNVILFEEITQNLLISTNCKTKNGITCEWNIFNKEGYVFIDSKNQLITDTENQTVNKLYKCKYKNSKSDLICYNMKNENTGLFPTGFYYNNEIKNSKHETESVLYKYNADENVWSIINVDELKKCTYHSYKNNTCYISYDDEDNGYTFENPKIDAENVCISRSSKLYFAISEINTGNDEINCIKLPTDASVNYYYVNKSKSYAADKYSFYNINEENLMNSLNSELIKSQSLLSSSSSFNGIIQQGDSRINIYTLTCNSNQCKKEKTIFCNYNFQTETCKTFSGSIVSGQTCTSPSTGKIYLALENVKSSTQGKCVIYSKNKSLTMKSKLAEIEFPDRKYVEIDKKLYYLNSESEVHFAKDGFYILDQWNYKITILPYQSIEIGSSSEHLFYICNEGICRRKEQCENGNLVEYIYDDLSQSVYQCDPLNHKISSMNNLGYYLNYPNHDLIRCYMDYNNLFKCVNINVKNGMEGYYLDAGNNDKIIKCRREDEKSFNCIEEDHIECSCSIIDGKCQSNVDLLRNSYCYCNMDYSVNETKPQKLVYIEKYIRAGDTGNCSINKNQEYYIKYKDSKFLGHEERNDLIKVSSDSIVSIYESTVGYYIISTETGEGIEKDTPLNKSRIYQCIKQNCVEVKPEVSGNIYINKGSTEKMVRFVDDQWHIIHHRCKIRNQFISNESQCVLTTSVKEGDIIYVSDSQSIQLYYVTLDVGGDKNPTTSNPTSETSKHILIKDGYYQYIPNDQILYRLSEYGQVFVVQEEPGYYIFDTNQNYNMEGYQSSVNHTLNKEDYYVYYNYQDKENQRTITKLLGNKIFNEEGYYWNKADLEQKGIILQIMKVPEKKTTNTSSSSNELTRKRGNSDENVTTKFKFLVHLCISTRKNICVSSQEDQILPRGSCCVVVDGLYRGLYLATNTIKSNSKTINCMKYEDSVLYEYVKDTMEFAGEPLQKTIIKVDQSVIQPFKHNIEDLENRDNYDDGYFVIDDENKLLNSTTAVQVTGYHCTIEYEKNNNNEKIANSESYECNPVPKSNQYFYANSKILYKNNYKWYEETKFGYYFYNENYQGATITSTESGMIPDNISGTSNNISKFGIYVNSMVTDKVILINYDGKYSIEEEPVYCIVHIDGSCDPKTNNDNLINGMSCYDTTTKKLYIISESIIINDEKEQILYKCYSGSENDMSYYYDNNNLYRMDGLSIQSMDEGYYILNENWKSFNNKYPDIPFIIIQCKNYQCNRIDNDLFRINSDIVINEAGTGSSQLLQIIPEGKTTKFRNASQTGYYFFNGENEVTTDQDNPVYTNIFELRSDGTIDRLDNTILQKDNTIYVNYAKSGKFSKNAKEYKHKLLNYDKEKDLIIFNGLSNPDNTNKVLQFLERGKSLYQLKSNKLVTAGKGLYAIRNGVPFSETSWTMLRINEEICYYDGEACDRYELNNQRNHKYMINNASGPDQLSIIEYDYNKDQWRVVKEDGYYFFFEEGYSITRTDRRIDKVVQILDGNEIDVTHSQNLLGYFIFDDLMVEGLGNGWEDAITVVENIDVVRRKQCISYEKDHSIDMNGFCYDSSLGVCVIKNEIKDDSADDKNCVFSTYDRKIKFYFINEQLYSFNDQMNHRINKSGLYVIDKFKIPYENEIESESYAYCCEGNKCGLAMNLDSQYYINMAKWNEEQPVILKYQNSTKQWSKTVKDGYYFFNEKGYPVSENENATYSYLVSDHGHRIENISRNQQKGIYVSQSNPYEEIIMINNGTWTTAQRVPTCHIYNTDDADDENTNLDNLILNSVKICLYQKQIMLYENTINEDGNSKKEFDATVSISNTDDDIIYSFDNTEKKLLILGYDRIFPVEINGIVVIDNRTKKSLTSVIPTKATALNCKVTGICEVLTDTLVTNQYYVNALSREIPLVQYIGNGQWMVVSTAGYYFLNEHKESITTQMDLVVQVIKVKKNKNIFSISDVNTNNPNDINKDEFLYDDLTKSKQVGFYLYTSPITINNNNNNNNNNENNYSNRMMMIKNNGNYWMKGEIVRSCDVTVLDNGTLCKPFDDDVNDDQGNYCYSNITQQLYLLTESVVDSESTSKTCIYGTTDHPRYILSDGVPNVFNGEVNMNISKRLIELTEKSITLAPTGSYLLNRSGELIEDDEITISLEDDEQDIQIYRCNTSECTKEYMTKDGQSFLSVTGKIYEYYLQGELKHLSQPTREGIYFFREDGMACASEEDTIAHIFRVTKETGGNKEKEIKIEIMKESDLEEDVYMNEADLSTVAVKHDQGWSIKIANCHYDKTTESCTNHNIELKVGSYCVSEETGEIYVIQNILNPGSKLEIKKCMAGRDENPIYIEKENDHVLMRVKRKTIKFVQDGYYALNLLVNQAYEAVVNQEESTPSRGLIHCDYTGMCHWEDPKVGYYLNQSPLHHNTIIYYPQREEAKEAQIMTTICTVNEEDQTCQTVVDNIELHEGDICLSTNSNANSNENSLYFVVQDGHCVKVEKTIISYRFLNHKLYRLHKDSVVQLFNGYYFVKADHRVVWDTNDYRKRDTSGYICSNVGDCYPLEPGYSVKYFPDYTTKYTVDQVDHFVLLKYDPEQQSRSNGTMVHQRSTEDDNDNNNSNPDPAEEEIEEFSGYEMVKEEGIFRMDDGYYAECEWNDYDEIDCHGLHKVGNFITKNEGGIVVSCRNNRSHRRRRLNYEDDENDMEEEENEKEDPNREIECEQLTKGGYYVMDQELYDCNILGVDENENENETTTIGNETDHHNHHHPLVCEKMKKEGYFLSPSKDILYECHGREGWMEIMKSLSEQMQMNTILKTSTSTPTTVTTTTDPNVDTTDMETMKTTEIETETETFTFESTWITTEIETGQNMEMEMEMKLEEVTCQPVECVLTTINNKKYLVTSDGQPVVMYECKKVMIKESTSEMNETNNNNNNYTYQFQWISRSCDSGNYIKDENGFYVCEEEKERLSEEYIKKPNYEHTVTKESPLTSTKSSKSQTLITITTTTATTTTTTTSTPAVITQTNESTTTTTSAPAVITQTSEPTTTTNEPESKGTSALVYILPISIIVVLGGAIAAIFIKKRRNQTN